MNRTDELLKVADSLAKMCEVFADSMLERAQRADGPEGLGLVLSAMALKETVDEYRSLRSS